MRPTYVHNPPSFDRVQKFTQVNYFFVTVSVMTVTSAIPGPTPPHAALVTVDALHRHTGSYMVMTMASKQVTITVDEELLSWFEQKAAQTGGKLSPTIARAARNWMLWEDAARLADADQRAGRNNDDHAEAELDAQREAEETEASRGHAA
jgi:hypothetical protein